MSILEKGIWVHLSGAIVTLHQLPAAIGLIGLIAACGYGLAAGIAALVWKWRRWGGTSAANEAAVTLLKPLYGAEPQLYENLRSFFVQTHPRFQIVFGVQDESDAAIPVVERLCAEFPDIPVALVVDPRQHGANRKVSNLINMLPYARYEILAIVDSDVRVDETYLQTVVAELEQEGVGLVTCTFQSVPAVGLWSRLGAMYMNDWYIPSVRLAWLFGHRGFASGQTLCLRRASLERCGGLEVLCDHLAEDYELGERVRGIGLETLLSQYVPIAQHHEPTLAHLIGHETRWMRTIRALRPLAFLALFVSFGLPVACVGFVLAHSLPSLRMVSVGLLAVAVVARLALFGMTKAGGVRAALRDLWLIPARDCLLLWVWWRALRTSRVIWRGHEFSVDSRGVMKSVV